MRSHKIGAISMGYGIIHWKLLKYRINYKSSTKAKLVGIIEYIPYNLWFIIFLKEQKNGINENVFFQDNKTDILMDNKSSNSCTDNSIHNNFRFFSWKTGYIKVNFRQILLNSLDVSILFHEATHGENFQEVAGCCDGVQVNPQKWPKILSLIKERVQNHLKYLIFQHKILSER